MGWGADRAVCDGVSAVWSAVIYYTFFNLTVWFRNGGWRRMGRGVGEGVNCIFTEVLRPVR